MQLCVCVCIYAIVCVRLVRAIQCMKFHAKNAKNDLNPTDLVKRKFCFETEGICAKRKC
jgi:hypothetical protein